MRSNPSLLFAALASVLTLALDDAPAHARAYTLTAPTAVQAPWTDALDVEITVDPIAPALVRAELVGWEIALDPAGDGRYTGTFALAPVPLPPGTYTITFHAEDEDGESTRFNQRLILGAPAGGATPWLPGERPTGGPLPIEVLSGLTFESGGPNPFSVRIQGAGRPARFEAFVAGYVGTFANQGDYRYDARFEDRWLLPPGDYTLRIEAADNAGEETTFETVLTITAPANGGTPWLTPVAPTLYEAEPLDFTKTVGGEPSTGCSGGDPGPLGIVGLAVLMAWELRRRRRAALLALVWALASGSACDSADVETRSVGRGEALIQVVDEGEGPVNQAPLWPLALGHRLDAAAAGDAATIVPGGRGRLWVTESWPTGGGRGMVLRDLAGGSDWLEIVQAEDGLYVTASARGGRLSRPMFFLPATVRVGMTWRTWARPSDLARLDLHPGEEHDDSGGFELRVTRLAEDLGASTARGRARVWEITWKGPRTPSGNFDSNRELFGHGPRVPSRGVMRFVEGYGPDADSAWLVPAVSYEGYMSTTLDDAFDPRPAGALVLPSDDADGADGPRVSLSALPRPEALDRNAIHQISVLDVADGHGPWLRFDGNVAGLAYPSAFPGSGGGGGNANLWQASPRSHCYALTGGALVSGQALGVLADDETCVHAAGTSVSSDGDAAFEVPFLSYFGAPVPRNVVEGCDDPGCAIGKWPAAALPAESGAGASLLYYAEQSPGGWHVAPWRAFDWSERFELNDLAATRAIDGAALDVVMGATPWSGSRSSPQLVAQALDDGAVGLLSRGANRYGEPVSFGFARLDADDVARDPTVYGPVGHGTSYRAGPGGTEIWQVDHGGRVWEWRFTADGMERRVRARLALSGNDETPTAAVRIDDVRLFVVTAGPAPDNVPPLKPRLECNDEYCWNQPHPAPPRLWTARLPPASDASPWERPPAIQGVTLSEDALTTCGPYTGAGADAPRLVTPPAGVTGAADADGRCLVVDPSGAAPGSVEVFTVQLPGTPAFRVVPATPLP